MLAQQHDGYHGCKLGQASHQQQLPRVDFRDVLDHHVAGGEAEASQDGTTVAKVNKGFRGVAGVIPDGSVGFRVSFPLSREGLAANLPVSERVVCGDVPFFRHSIRHFVTMRRRSQ